ncbi:hypothetical protein LQU92_11725 [Kocuria sp. LUK]|uniref:spore germination protein GerW family protein n=1 Tax=Kocuria sp. LUK TaxID=2897828 RepID=UPI001E2FE9A5|nr:spore germination protein GerW family protein [Kocuria sp. LUK]MCD1145893.1 hypothetical protein [Kocuria sp. LUK]
MTDDDARPAAPPTAAPGPGPAQTVPPAPAPGRAGPPGSGPSGIPDRAVLERSVDALTVRRVFGEAYELGAATVIPVARVRGAGGGGGGYGQEEHGSGGGQGLGYGVRAEPAGAFVVTGDRVSWQPAVDAERIALTSVLAFFATAAAVGLAVLGRRR